MAAQPFVAALGPLWATVIDRCESRCCCTGQCGRKHPERVQGRCPVGAKDGERLYAAPTDPSIPAAQAHEVPETGLAAWCGPCLDGARRRAAVGTPANQTTGSLFDLLDGPEGSAS